MAYNRIRLGLRCTGVAGLALVPYAVSLATPMGCLVAFGALYAGLLALTLAK